MTTVQTVEEMANALVKDAMDKAAAMVAEAQEKAAEAMAIAEAEKQAEVNALIRIELMKLNKTELADEIIELRLKVETMSEKLKKPVKSIPTTGRERLWAAICDMKWHKVSAITQRFGLVSDNNTKSYMSYFRKEGGALYSEAKSDGYYIKLKYYPANYRHLKLRTDDDYKRLSLDPSVKNIADDEVVYNN